MNKKVHDPNMPVGKLTRVVDDLPPPSELAKPLQGVRITIIVSKSSVEYFKTNARKYHTKYQRMMREVLDSYVSRQAVAH